MSKLTPANIIPLRAVEETALELMRRAAVEIPDDYRQGIRAMVETEDSELGRFVLESMLENWDVAIEDGRAMCADTGLPRYFVKVGNEAQVEGGFVALEAALRGRAEAEGVGAGELIHPLRVAVSGRGVSPDIFKLCELLGRERVLDRLRARAWERAASA